MKKICNDAGMLVRYHVYNIAKKDYIYVGGYFTNQVENTIKYLILAIENEIEVSFNDCEETLRVDGNMANEVYSIEDLTMTLPSDTSAMCLEVYLR